MRNNKLIKSNQRFMWANILLGVFVIAIIFAFVYLCGIL